MDKDLAQAAKILDDAAVTATAVAQLSGTHDYSLQEAYEIQKLSINRRLARDETLTGIKMGFTSRAKMRQMGVSETIWGRLTNTMLVEDGGEISLTGFIHPRVEPEVAFLLKKPLSGPVSLMQAAAAIEAVAPAMEIIDSRYENFKFTLEDVVADNCSSSAYVIGPWNRPEIDISNLGMIFQINNRPVGIGSSAAILGNPLRSLVTASRLLAQYGLRLEPDWIVMAGSATEAQYLASDTHVLNEVEKLGRVEFRVTEST